ncbi:MAG: ADP-ribosylglycohydrolase family protein [Myxococcota bacterium]
MPSPRVHASLLGLTVGDAFGETFFRPGGDGMPQVLARALAPAPWRWTDDTAMALGVVEVLREHGRADPDRLATVFARDHARDPYRGYGAGAREILLWIERGMPWRWAAGQAFGGQGSMGNGAAMRAAPIGAWFGGDLDRVKVEALASAAPTHAHPDGAAGAVAVAVAAAVAGEGGSPDAVWEAVLELTPDGETRAGLARARALPADASVRLAAAALGTGWRVLSSDTVPFAIWCATRDLDDYEEALWRTVEGLGDRDTTCAIVGGIVGARVGVDGIPPAWRDATEAWPAIG